MGAAASASDAGQSDATLRIGVRSLDLPASVIEVYRITKNGTKEERRMRAKFLLDRCVKPSRGRDMLGHGGFGAVFRVEIPASDASAAGGDAPDAPDHIAVKTVFNWGHSTSKLETIDSRKEFDVLVRLPEHRNLARVLFECVCKPPLWMVEMLPDPSLVCIDAGEGAGAEGLPSGGATSLRPRKAQMVGMELLQRRMCDHLEIVEGDEPGSMPDHVLVQLSRDIAEGVHHLLQHGVVHRDLKLDNVMWDSKGGPEGVGRAVLIDFGCSLRVHVDEVISSSAAAAAVTAAGSAGSRPASRVEEALDRVTYRYLVHGGDGPGGNQAHMAPEMLDGWSKGVAGDDAAVVPFGKQASWALGVLLHELATGGQHPFGDEYPDELYDGSQIVSTELTAALHACEAPMAGHDVLSRRPTRYVGMLHNLLCIDPGDRMDVGEALRELGSLFVRTLMPALLAGGAECESAVVRVRKVVDGLVARGDWDGVYRVLWQLRVESGIRHPEDFVEGARHLLDDIHGTTTEHVLSDTSELERIIGGLGSEGGLEAEMAAFLIWQTSACVDPTLTLWPTSRMLGGLMALLESGKGREAELAARALRSIAVGSDARGQAVVDAGVLGGLVALLGSSKGKEAEQAAGAIRNVTLGSDVRMKAVVDAGALCGLVALLGSDKGSYAELAAGTLGSIAAGSDDLKQAVVDAGALGGLVALLGSDKGMEAECAAGALSNLAWGSNVRTGLHRQAIVDTGALGGLVALLGSCKGREAEQAARALWNITAGSAGLKQAVIDAGVLGGLVALLESGKGREAELAAGAISGIAGGSDARGQAVVDAGALGGLVALLGSGKGMEAEQASGAIRNVAVGSDARMMAVIDAGALGGLVALLGSGKGREAEQAAGVLGNISVRSASLEYAVVDAGALIVLVELLGSGKGREAEQAAGVLYNLAWGSDDVKQAVVDAGALGGLVALLESGKGREAELAAGALWNIAFGSAGLEYAIVDAGALCGLVALLGSGKGREAELAAGALANIAPGPDVLKQAVVDAGSLGGLVALLGSGKGREAEHAAGAIRNITAGSDVCRRAAVDAGALSRLVALLESGKGREAEQASGAIRNITAGSDV